MQVRKIIVTTGMSLSEAIPEMLELSQAHDAPVVDSDLNVTVYPLDSEDSALQRAEAEHEQE